MANFSSGDESALVQISPHHAESALMANSSTEASANAVPTLVIVTP